MCVDAHALLLSVCVCVCVCMHTHFVRSYPSNLILYRQLVKRVGPHKVYRPMMNRGQLPTNQLHVHDVNWGALDHAFRTPQLMSCNYFFM